MFLSYVWPMIILYKFIDRNECQSMKFTFIFPQDNSGYSTAFQSVFKLNSYELKECIH